MLPIPSSSTRRTALFSACRVNVKNASSRLASCRSRKLGTAFRSPVTTLSPPLRGQCSRPAPSLPHRCLFANPFDRRLLRSVRFRSRNRANSSPSTRCPRRSPALSRCYPTSTPLRVSQPSGSKRSTGCTTTSSLRLTPDCSLLPVARSFDFASDQRSKPGFALLRYRSVNPGTESIMYRKREFVKLKNGATRALSSAFFRLIFQ